MVTPFNVVCYSVKVKGISRFDCAYNLNVNNLLVADYQNL